MKKYFGVICAITLIPLVFLPGCRDSAQTESVSGNAPAVTISYSVEFIEQDEKTLAPRSKVVLHITGYTNIDVSCGDYLGSWHFTYEDESAEKNPSLVFYDAGTGAEIRTELNTDGILTIRKQYSYDGALSEQQEEIYSLRLPAGTKITYTGID